jgi:hypothetical protein
MVGDYEISAAFGSKAGFHHHRSVTSSIYSPPKISPPSMPVTVGA